MCYRIDQPTDDCRLEDGEGLKMLCYVWAVTIVAAAGACETHSFLELS